MAAVLITNPAYDISDPLTDPRTTSIDVADFLRELKGCPGGPNMCSNSVTFTCDTQKVNWSACFSYLKLHLTYWKIFTEGKTNGAENRLVLFTTAPGTWVGKKEEDINWTYEDWHAFAIDQNTGGKWKSHGSLRGRLPNKGRGGSKGTTGQAARSHDKRATDRSYNVGDWVYLNRRNIKEKSPHRKLDWKFIGPYQVLKRYGKKAYRLDLPANFRFHDVFMFRCWQRIPRRVRLTAQLLLSHLSTDILTNLPTDTFTFTLSSENLFFLHIFHHV